MSARIDPSRVLAAVSIAAIVALTVPALAAVLEPVTPQLITAARQEGKVVFYTAIDLLIAEKIAKAFEAAYPGVAVQIERTGSERMFQRVNQERANSIYAADVLDGSDQSMFITMKRQGMLDAFMPAEVAAKWPADQRDPDGYFASHRFTLMPIAYNTNLVRPDDAPQSYADLLDPKWAARIVKAHPSYSGGIVTSTFQISRALGWDYLQKLGRQRVMQVQSGTEPPKKLALGERAIAADGLEYVSIHLKESGSPLAIIYPREGTPFIPGCAAIASKAPHPNAARLFYSYLFSREAQQFLADFGGMRSFHPDVKLKDGRKPLSEIKLMTSDPEAQERDVDEIKKKYAEYFGI